MAVTMWHQHLINPCSEQDQAERWHPQARIFWSEGVRALEQRLMAPNAVTFESQAAADDHAVRKLARPWIARLMGDAPVAGDTPGSSRQVLGEHHIVRTSSSPSAPRPTRRPARRRR